MCLFGMRLLVLFLSTDRMRTSISQTNSATVGNYASKNSCAKQLKHCQIDPESRLYQIVLMVLSLSHIDSYMRMEFQSRVPVQCLADASYNCPSCVKSIWTVVLHQNRPISKKLVKFIPSTNS